MVMDRARVTLQDCIFDGNRAEYGRGGGIYVADQAAVVANNIIIRNRNTAK